MPRRAKKLFNSRIKKAVQEQNTKNLIWSLIEVQLKDLSALEHDEDHYVILGDTALWALLKQLTTVDDTDTRLKIEKIRQETELAKIEEKSSIGEFDSVHTWLVDAETIQKQIEEQGSDD